MGLPVADLVSPLHPHSENGVLDGLEIPAALAGGVESPAQELIEGEGTKAGEGRAVRAGGTFVALTAGTVLLEIEELQGVG
jgi:hypothetical protein